MTQAPVRTRPPRTSEPPTGSQRAAASTPNLPRAPRRSRALDHTGSARVSLLLFLALALALSSLHSLLSGVGWLITTVGIAAVVLGAAAATRVLVRNRWAASAVAVLVSVGALTLLFAPTTAIAGVVPTGETWAAFRTLSAQATASIMEQGIPADAVPGLLFLLSWATAIMAALIDLVANWWRAPALVGIPLLFVLSVPSLIDGALGDPWLFALTAVVYLLLLRPHVRRIQSTLALGIGAAAVLASLVLPLVLPAVTPNTGGVGARNAVATGVNPILNLGDDLRRSTPTTALTYTSTSPRGQYLRLTTLDAFEGDRWEPDPIRELPDNNVDAFGGAPGLTPDVLTNPIVSDITIRNVIGRWLPVPYPATSVSGLKGDWFWEPDGLSVRTMESNMRGQEYSVSSLELEPTSDQLAAAGDSSGSDLAAVPAGLDPIVATTAREVVGDAATDYDRAIALQSWFRSDFNYSEEAPVREGFDGSGLEVLAPFLEAKSGYCVHFASAMAVMARTLGIPSRVVVGFLPGDPRVDRDGSTEFTVSSNDLHAWPELFFEGTGWVRFEPTPGRGIDATFTSAPVDNPSTPNVDESQASTPPVTSAPTTAPSVAPTGDPAGALSPADTVAARQGWLTSFVTLAVLLLLAGPSLLRMGLRGRRFAAIQSAQSPAAEAWIEVADTARDLGLVGTYTGTPRELAARIGKALRPEAHLALDGLRVAVEREVFAARDAAVPTDVPPEVGVAQARVSPVSIAQASSSPVSVTELTVVLRGLRHARGIGARVRATLLPKSLFDRIRAVRVKFGR
jgi:transglutaminase-like putative cysteine protease